MANVLKKAAAAGFAEKNDLLVTVMPGEFGSGVKINLTSSVIKQYGRHIKNIISETVKAAGFADVVLQVQDKGAWDYTIRARVQAALARGMK